jgi:hypothetical protein
MAASNGDRSALLRELVHQAEKGRVVGDLLPVSSPQYVGFGGNGVRARDDNQSES